MASFSCSPAAVHIASGTVTFIPPRFSGAAANIRFTTGESTLSIISAAATPKLDRLFRLVDQSPTEDQRAFKRRQEIWQNSMQAIETAFTEQGKSIAALQQALDLARAGLTKANAIDDKISVEGSYTSPTSVGSANSSGTVTIAAHTRIYSGVSDTSRDVDAGSVSSLSGGDYVTIFYRDAARAGGAVTYEATTNAVAQTGNIHIVWQGAIPNSGEPANTGTSPSAPGYTPPSNGGNDYEEF